MERRHRGLLLARKVLAVLNPCLCWAELLCFLADSQTDQQITRIKKQPFWFCSSTLTSGGQSGKDRQIDRQTHPSLCSALIKMLTEFVMWTCFFHFSIMYNEHCGVTCLAVISV